jgi:hypothetical protein
MHLKPSKLRVFQNLRVPAFASLSQAALLSATFSAGESGYFEKKVRPLLEEHCLECHSAAKKIKGGLRLDFESGWKTGGDSGPALVPNDPDASLLIKAVRYRDPDFQMPPRKKLAPREIDILEEWVRTGAPDPRRDDPASQSAVHTKSKALPLENATSHWAYRAIARHAEPVVKNASWAQGAIDRFLLHAMEQAPIQPVRDADATTVCRRLHLLLTGLPPEAEAIEAFEQEYQRDRREAVSKTADSLMASPAFAEAFARRWLDLTRFAESSGGGRTLLFKDAWRYRDYVLHSIHADVPLNRFITEQIAGDLLPASTVKERAKLLTATGFLALGPTNYEEQDKQQLRFDIIDEQLDTIGKAFLGQTIGCARCHDHKFDPIPQRDYYALAGIFSSTRTLHNLTDNVARWVVEPLPGYPEEERLESEHKQKVAQLRVKIEAARNHIARLNSSPLHDQSFVKGPVTIERFHGIVLDDTDAKLVGAWKSSSFFKNYVGVGYLTDDNTGKGEKTATFTPSFPNSGRYEVRFAYSAGPNRSKDVRVTVFHADGEEVVTINETEEPAVDGHFTSLGTFRFEKDGAGFVLVSNAGGGGHVVVDAVQFIQDAMPAPRTVAVASSSANGANGAASSASADASTNGLQTDATSVGSNTAVHSESASKEADPAKDARATLASLNEELKQLEKKAPPRSVAMVVSENVEISDTALRVRGVAKQKGEIVPRGFLRAVTVDDAKHLQFDGTQSGRAQFAQWLVSDQNPLTARVLVNRIWAWVFGAGLVGSTENFGTTGEKPTHPELLDYLSARFIEQGWSLKQLVREMVTSHAWRLAEEAPVSTDPSNKLLSRHSVRRLDADQIRDSMLHAAGRLNREFGGPNINGAKEINANESSAANIEYNYVFTDVRRSLYTPAFRNRRHEVFDVFDFGDINNSIGVREASTVAPQALFFLNSVFAGEQAKCVGDRFAGSEPDAAVAIEKASMAILGRRPSNSEAKVLSALYKAAPEREDAAQRLARVAHALFASVDFRYIR